MKYNYNYTQLYRGILPKKKNMEWTGKSQKIKHGMKLKSTKSKQFEFFQFGYSFKEREWEIQDSG